MTESKYRPIATQLEAEIEGLASGSKLASEAELGRRFGVGRSTVRAALHQLELRAVIRRVNGVGSFVVRRVDYRIDSSHAPSWSETVIEGGGVPSSAVLSCGLADPPEHVRRALGLAPDARIFRLTRRSDVDGLPAAWGVEWVPESISPALPRLIRSEGSLFRLLGEGRTEPPRRAWVRAFSETTTTEVARQLGLAETTPCWLVESLMIDPLTAEALCLSQRWIRTDAIRLLFESGA